MSESIPTWCWYCKQEIPTVADVCPYCGKPLNDATKVVRCRKCGKFLLKNVPSCTQCGEPTPQPEPPAPPEEPPAQDAEAGAPPPELPEGAAAAGTSSETPETMRMFEELEMLSARKAQANAARNASKKRPMTVIITALAIVVGVGAFLAISRLRTSSAPTFCKENEHQWIGADCTSPKTCAICGKIEGERLGHTFVENVCEVCGKYERLFYFIDSGSERSGGEVIFRGSVKNFTDSEVQSVQIKLQLYDENKELVETLPGATIENMALAPLESTAWQIRYSNSSVKWKYWRVYVSDYSPRV